jgi:hypothetical protein
VPTFPSGVHLRRIAGRGRLLMAVSEQGRDGARPSRTPGKRMTSGVQVPCGEGG